MQSWLETLGIFILADLGIILGLLTKKLKKRLWLIGYVIPLLLIILIGLTRHFYWLSFHRPFSWVCAGRREYVIFSFAIPMLFSTLIPRISIFRLKVLIVTLVTVCSVVFFIIPFVSPILIRKDLENIKTEISYDGICIQATDYTCGPAAAVTALYQLGIIADEGEIAILAYTTPQTGTSDDLLIDAIEKLYSSQGIVCTYKRFFSIKELKHNCPAIVVTKYSFLIDHYVTVLKVTDDKVIIGNSSSGIEVLFYEEFEKKWRSVGIIVKNTTI